MSYRAQPIFFYSSYEGDPQVKAAISQFIVNEWLPKHSTAQELILHHYTSLEGLRGILTNRSIWFTHVSTLNDPLELRYGKKLVLDIIKTEVANESNEYILKIFNEIVNFIEIFDTISYQFYVACFCEENNLLSQWRSYSEKGVGYNIGIRFSSDTKYSNNASDLTEDSYIILRKIIYDVDEQIEIISRYVQSIISNSKDAIQNFRAGRVPIPWTSRVAMDAVNILFDLILSFKNDAFKEEKEWRLIHGRLTEHKSEQLRFRDMNSKLIPYLETYIFEDIEDKHYFPVRKIMCGPMLDEYSAKSVINLFLHSIGNLQTNININVSNIKISHAGFILR